MIPRRTSNNADQRGTVHELGFQGHSENLKADAFFLKSETAVIRENILRDRGARILLRNWHTDRLKLIHVQDISTITIPEVQNLILCLSKNFGSGGENAEYYLNQSHELRTFADTMVFLALLRG